MILLLALTVGLSALTIGCHKSTAKQESASDQPPGSTSVDKTSPPVIVTVDTANSSEENVAVVKNSKTESGSTAFQPDSQVDFQNSEQPIKKKIDWGDLGKKSGSPSLKTTPLLESIISETVTAVTGVKPPLDTATGQENGEETPSILAETTVVSVTQTEPAVARAESEPEIPSETLFFDHQAEQNRRDVFTIFARVDEKDEKPDKFVSSFAETSPARTKAPTTKVQAAQASTVKAPTSSVKKTEADVDLKQQEQTPPPWAYGTVADSFLSSNPTRSTGQPARIVMKNMQDDVDDPFFGSSASTETPTDSGGKEDQPDRDPFGGSDDFAPEADSSQETPAAVKPRTPAGDASTLQKPKVPAAKNERTSEGLKKSEDLEKWNELLENLTAAEQYLMNEAKRSPVRLMESVGTLVQMQRPVLVRRLLQDFKQQELEPEDFALISQKIRPEVLMRLTNDPDYAPDGAETVRRIVDGAKSHFESKTLMEDSLKTLLTSTVDSEKEEAIQSLLRGGHVAIEILLGRLIAAGNKREVDEISSLLYRMGEDARPAVTELLLLRNESSVRAAAILTRMGKKVDAKLMFPLMYDPNLSDTQRGIIAGYVQHLIGKIPTPQEGSLQLYAEAMNYFRGRVPFRTDVDGNVRTWVFREGALIPSYVVISESDASRYHAEKYARIAAFLGQNNTATRTLWLATYFDLKGHEGGLDISIHENKPLVEGITRSYSLAEIEGVLRFSMSHNHPIAARVAVEFLGSIGTAEALLYKSGSAMIKAVGYSDRRVRFAALEAIMKWNPDRPYPGSSVVSESLVYFTRSGGIKRAIVAAPKIAESQEVASYLLPLGYVPATTTTGMEAMRMAINSADTELMMIDTRTPSRGLQFLLQDMYLDNRTHDVPIAVYAVTGEETRGSRAVIGAVHARAYYRPHDEDTVKLIVEHLLKETGVEHVPKEIRLESARKAILWVTRLFGQTRIYRFENIEDAVMQVIWTPELVMDAMDLASQIRSMQAQLILTTIASDALNPLDHRQKAVDAFDTSVEKHGVLLRGRQILDLYDSYNASAAEPKESQQLRGRLLDIIETFAESLSKR